MKEVLIEWVDTERWMFICFDHPFRDVSRGNKASETIDRYIDNLNNRGVL